MSKFIPILPKTVKKNGKCRTCLKECDSLRPIYSKISVCGDKIALNELLMKCASVQVNTAFIKIASKYYSWFIGYGLFLVLLFIGLG